MFALFHLCSYTAALLEVALTVLSILQPFK